MMLQTLGRPDGAPMDWAIEDTIGNWWRPNFEPPQVIYNAKYISGIKQLHIYSHKKLMWLS